MPIVHTYYINIISRNKTQHQKFIHNIEQKVASMGLILKPSKCKSLSIQAGKSNDVTFVLEDDKQVKTHIETLTESSHKFLGSLITFNSKPQDYFDHLSNIFKDKLENIDKSKIRGEYKLAIYERYALCSMRYHFSIHPLHKAHLEQ